MRYRVSDKHLQFTGNNGKIRAMGRCCRWLFKMRMAGMSENNQEISEYMYRKPNRRIFELALEKAGLEAADVWYIGDQYQCDIVGAANAGLFPVWYLGATKRQEEPVEGVLTIRHWRKLQECLL